MGANFWQCGVRLQETVKLAEDQRLSLVSSGAAGFVTQEAVILGDGIPLDPFDAAAYNQGEALARGAASNFLTSFAAPMAPIFTELAKVINPTGTSATGIPAVAPAAVLPNLYLFMGNALAAPNTAGFASAPVVNSRNITRGSISAGGSNVGSGTIYRLTVDRFGYPLEGDYAEKVQFICTADNQSGTLPGQEQFSGFGQPFRDALSWYASNFGSGLTAPGGLVGVTGDTTVNLIQNPSFSASSGTGGTSDFVLTGWTRSSGLAASMSLDTSNYYRACSLEGSTPASLKLTASVTLTQQIAPNNTAGNLALTAYLNQIAWNGSIGTWSGSFTVQVGSKSWSVSSGASGWQTLRPSLDKNLWLPNFDTAALAVTITATVTSGYLLLDDFCWAPFTDIGGKLFWAVGGATKWIVNDNYSFTDTEPASPSKVQNWIRLMFPGFFLPSIVVPTAPASAATLVQSATAGAVTAGAHVGYVTFVTAVGESGLGPASTLVVVDGTKKIDWSSIPLGGVGVTSRGLYRTKANSSGVAGTPYLVAYIADNVTTTYADNTADASLVYLPGTIPDPS